MVRVWARLKKLMEIVCTQRKLELPFPYSLTHRESRALEMIHEDLCGPIELEILGGSKYLLFLIDD